MPKALMLLPILLASSAIAAPQLSGTYSSPLGGVSVKAGKGDLVKATSLGGGPCQFKKGQVVFEGSLLDDSLTGEVHSCKIGNECTGNIEGMIMLLVSQKGKLLSGAVHLETGKCSTPLKGDAISFVRSESVGSISKADLKKNKNGKSSSVMDLDLSSKPIKTKTKGTTKTSPKNRATKSGPPDGKIVPGDRAQAEAKAREALPAFQGGRYEEARKLLRLAIKLDPSYDQGYNLVGATYVARDRYDEGLAWYKRALEINPSNHDVYYNMACIYALQDEKEKSLRYLQISLLNGYIDVNTLEADEDLRVLDGNPEFEKLKSGEF